MQRLPTTRDLRSLAWALLLVPLGASIGAAADGRGIQPADRGTLARLDAVLNVLCAPDLDKARDWELARLRLRQLGPGAVPSLFALLAGSAPVPDVLLDEGPLLTDERRSLIFDALRAWDPARVAEEVNDALGSDAGVHARIVAMDLLGEVTGARGLETLISIIESIDPATRSHPSVAAAATRALRTSLERDELALVVLSARAHKLGPPTRFIAADALGQVGTPAALELLDSMLSGGRSGRTPGLDAHILGNLARLDEGRFLRASSDLIRIVEPYVRSRDTQVRREALRSVARLRPVERIEDLITLLTDHDRVVGEGALEALHAISGKRWDNGPERWWEWYRGEQLWLEEEAPALLEALHDADPAQVVQILRRLTQHPAFRVRLSEEIARVLRYEETASATFAARTLGQLGTPQALRPLVEALFDARPEVVEAAADALRRITGQDLPSRANPWRDWLDA